MQEKKQFKNVQYYINTAHLKKITSHEFIAGHNKFFFFFIFISIIVVYLVLLLLKQTQVLAGHASSLDSVRVEGESATFSGPVAVVADAQASGGQAIQFGTVASTTSTPTPTPVLGTSSSLLPGQQIWNNGVSSYIFGSNDTEEWGNDNVQTDPHHIIQSSMKNAKMQLERTFIFHYSLRDGHRLTIGTNPQANALQLLGTTNSVQTEFGTPSTQDIDTPTGYEVENRVKTVENMGMNCLVTFKDIWTTPSHPTDPAGRFFKPVIDPDTGKEETDLDFAKKVVAYLGPRCNMYEIGNESDLDEYTDNNTVVAHMNIQTYVERWTEFVHALKKINPNAKFIGPVTYDDQGNDCWYTTANGAKPYPETQSGDCYMRNFMHGVVDANDPTVLPDGISFHWYTDNYCGDTSAGASCNQTNIQATYTNVINEVRGWVNSDLLPVEKGQLGRSAVPIGITEWNANPGSPQYMVKDATFAQQWTTWALQGMIAAHLDFGNQFDTQSEGGYCYLDMFNSCNGTDQPTGMFTGMQTVISQYHP